MQQYLTGRVLDRDTNAPIAGARVCLKFKGLRLRAQTAADGTFRIALPPVCGAVGLVISRCGFYPRHIAELCPGAARTFRMTPAE